MTMEAFEQFVAVAMEEEGLVVSSAVKFFVKRKTKKQIHNEYQEHGYEVDLVGANSKKLVLATVKSFFGSKGVQAREVTGASGTTGAYRLLNDLDLRAQVIAKAHDRYKYPESKIFLRLYVGKFAGKGGADEAPIREWCGEQKLKSGPIEVFSVNQVVSEVKKVAARRTYVNNPSIVALKVLQATGDLDLQSVASEDAARG